MNQLSPMGYNYRFDPGAPSNQRLTRKGPKDETWGTGMPGFDVQTMSPDELRFVAQVIDDARAAYSPFAA